MRVTLVLAPAARTVWEQTLELPHGTTVEQAWHSVEWATTHPHAAPGEAWAVSIWGRKAAGSDVLREGDRVEWLRPLLVDPKVARRERFRGQGGSTPGLFSRRKSGA